MYVSYLRYPELIFKGRPVLLNHKKSFGLGMTRIWLVGAQVRAASNGELEGFKKDGMKVTGGPEKRTCRTCLDTKWMKVT